ncbi:MAG: Holliday junction resolvase RuvX [Muribaculaceae bacterium]
MGRLLSIDYGRKRCGIAVTDVLKIVATGLTTVATANLVEFIKQYVEKEDVERIVVGLPTTMRGEQSESMKYITPGINRLRKELPGMEIVFFDERFTSVLAHKSMLASGMKKTDRQDKAIVDEISATIILNDYLQSKSYNQ